MRHSHSHRLGTIAIALAFLCFAASQTLGQQYPPPARPSDPYPAIPKDRNSYPAPASKADLKRNSGNPPEAIKLTQDLSLIHI